MGAAGGSAPAGRAAPAPSRYGCRSPSPGPPSSLLAAPSPALLVSLRSVEVDRRALDVDLAAALDVQVLAHLELARPLVGGDLDPLGAFQDHLAVLRFDRHVLVG